MTYIHPSQHKNILNIVLAGLVALSLVGIFCLVGLYNNIVNLDHNVAAAKTELDSIGAKNTALNNQVIAALGNIQGNTLAANDGLIEDNHPQYIAGGVALNNQLPVTSNQKGWPIASQQ